MEQSARSFALNESDHRVLREFSASYTRPYPSDRFFLGMLAGLTILLFVISQLLMRWAPGHLEARGLAVCSHHATPHHGLHWLPIGPDFSQLCRVPGATGACIAMLLGMAWVGFYLQNRRVRQLGEVLSRVLADRSPP